MNFKNIYRQEILTAKEITNIRENLGMNYTQFGRFFRVSHAIVPLWERGKTSPMPALSELIRIKSSPEYLEVNKEELKMAMFRKDRPTNLMKGTR